VNLAALAATLLFHDASTFMISQIKRMGLAGAVFLTSFVLLFHGVVAKLVADWGRDENYSHGYLIVPLAVYFVWQRRAALARARVASSSAGLLLLIGSVLVFGAGVLAAELFLTRIAMIGVIAGAALYVFGPAVARLLAFPIAFLLVMVPLPAIVFNQIAFPLQLLASRAGEAALSAVHIPVLREGNLIVLASTTLEVAEACSGIRSLVSLLALGIVYGELAEPRAVVRLVLAAMTVPVAIAANAMRVAGTGIAAEYAGAAAAQGFLHTFAGWLMFIVAFACLIGVHRLIQLIGSRGSVAPMAAEVA
jgi:exosortase